MCLTWRHPNDNSLVLSIESRVEVTQRISGASSTDCPTTGERRRPLHYSVNSRKSTIYNILSCRYCMCGEFVNLHCNVGFRPPVIRFPIPSPAALALNLRRYWAITPGVVEQDTNIRKYFYLCHGSDTLGQTSSPCLGEVSPIHILQLRHHSPVPT